MFLCWCFSAGLTFGGQSMQGENGFKNPLRKRAWSPYVAGAAIGVLSWFTFATTNNPVGITTSFEHTAALGTQIAAPDYAESNSYYAEQAKAGKAPKISWEWMLVAGVFLGALLSASLSGDRTKEKVPKLWAWRFGPSTAKRFAGAFFGGALMMFGARLAQGCTSGHGISGTLQLALSSWMFVAVLFLVGIATSFLTFRKEGRAHV
jgi:uncharacterized protein